MDIMTAHQVASGEAKAEAKVLESMHGDGYPCGFAWVTSYVKGNTKEGKALKAAGFKKSYSGGGYQLWNPSGSYVQNVDIKEAEKIADKVKSGKNFDLDDFKRLERSLPCKCAITLTLFWGL